jgi:hypothetical protein
VNPGIADVSTDVRVSKSARRLFLGLNIRRQDIFPRLVQVGAWLATITSTLLIALAILHSAVAALSSVAAGAAVRWLGQALNLKQLRRSPKPGELATFTLQGEAILCIVDEARILRYTSAWRWRIAAAIAAGGICVGAQHLPVLEFNLLPEFIRSLHWLYPLIEGCSAILPVISCILFIRAKGPEGHWADEAKAAIEARVTASVSRILKPRELDGLAAGVEVLWHALGLERRGEYRAAVAKHLRAHIAAAALQPEAADIILDAMTELARQDLRDLSASLESYRAAERHLKAVQTLATAIREPWHEMKAEELSTELAHLSNLASERRWEELQRRAVWLENELDGLRATLSQHSASVPPVVLAAGSDPYRVLGISVDTPTPLVRKLRLSLAQLYHPDISHGTRSSAKMAELNAAYDAVMKDREREGRQGARANTG